MTTIDRNGHLTKAAFTLALITGVALSGSALAQVGSRTGEAQRTRVRFDRPVQIPNGQILPPGTYIFSRLDMEAARDNAVQIFAEDGTREIAKVMTNDTRRDLPTTGTFFEFVDPAAIGGMGASGTGSASGMSGTMGSTGTTSGTTSGTSGTTSGTSGTTSGSSGTTSGSSGTTPGSSGTTSGSSGTTPSGTSGTGTTSGTTSGSGTTTGGTSGTTATGTMGGTTAGTQDALILKAWYYPGTRDGQEFMYTSRPEIEQSGRKVVMQVGPDYSLRPVGDADTIGESSNPGHVGSDQIPEQKKQNPSDPHRDPNPGGRSR